MLEVDRQHHITSFEHTGADNSNTSVWGKRMHNLRGRWQREVVQCLIGDGVPFVAVHVKHVGSVLTLNCVGRSFTRDEAAGSQRLAAEVFFSYAYKFCTGRVFFQYRAIEV